MSYFTEQNARSIIRNAYGEVQSDDTKVAVSIYGAEGIAGLPRSASLCRWEWVTPCATPGSSQAKWSWTWVAARESTRFLPPWAWGRRAELWAST
jgi:hypothetical protein